MTIIHPSLRDWLFDLRHSCKQPFLHQPTSTTTAARTGKQKQTKVSYKRTLSTSPTPSSICSNKPVGLCGCDGACVNTLVRSAQVFSSITPVCHPFLPRSHAHTLVLSPLPACHPLQSSAHIQPCRASSSNLLIYSSHACPGLERHTRGASRATAED